MWRLEFTVSQAVLVLQTLCLQQSSTPSSSSKNPSATFSPHKIIAILARRFDSMKHPSARASVLWLVGQYAPTHGSVEETVVPGIHDWAPDVLRKVAKSFAEEVSVKPPHRVSVRTNLYRLTIR